MAHKSHHDPVKQKWREAWYHFIRTHKHHLRGNTQRWQIVCFPGAEALELEVYDRLGVPRENVLGLESDPKVWEKLQKKQLGIRLTDEPTNALDYFQSTNEQFDIVSLDFEGQFTPAVIDTLAAVASRQLLYEESLFELVTYGKRDQPITKFIQNMAFMEQEHTQRAFEALNRGESVPNPEEKVKLTFEEMKKRSRKDLRDSTVTELTRNIFELGLDCTRVNPIFQENPEFEKIEEFVENNFPPEVRHLSDHAKLQVHYRAFVKHLLESGMGSQKEANFLATIALRYSNKSYMCADIARFEYVSQGAATMLSDFFHFSQRRKLLANHRYIAEHAYVDINFDDYMWSLFKEQPKTEREKRRKIRTVGMKRRTLGTVIAQSCMESPERIFLGSSAKRPILTGRIYYQERYSADEQGTPIEEVHAKLLEQFKVTPSQLSAFESHYTMETHGPVYVKPEENSGIEVSIEQFHIIPDKYWNRLPAAFRKRITYFVEEDIGQVVTSLEDAAQICQEIRGSKWYKEITGETLSETQFYAFFDDITLELMNGHAVDRKKIQQLFERVQQKGWKEPRRKEMLTGKMYEQLSFYEGKSDTWILRNYQTPKPNSLRAFKAWVTMRHRERPKRDPDLGLKVARMIAKGEKKEEIKNQLSLEEFQYRGYLAAFRRGAYRERLMGKKKYKTVPRMYVDSHGVVHTQPSQRAEIEKGYR